VASSSLAISKKPKPLLSVDTPSLGIFLPLLAHDLDRARRVADDRLCDAADQLLGASRQLLLIFSNPTAVFPVFLPRRPGA
jgi:hypothetical protein